MKRSPIGRTIHPALVLTAGITAYVIAVLQRTSFGVSGPQAAEHFEVNATLLSVFVAVQLVVYAGCQIPVGIALDRFGVRAVVAVGSVTMGAGQLVLAFTDSVELALVARALIGAGDACIFIAVVRLVPAWFSPRAAPTLTQVISMVGQLGQVLSAVPFLMLLRRAGWQPAFTTLAVIGVMAGLIAWIGIRNHPGESPGVTAVEPARVYARNSERHKLRDVLREPGTWLGYWTHFVTGFSPMVAIFMWAVPFLGDAQGLSGPEISFILALNPVAIVVLAPLVGMASARYPLRRSWIVLSSAVVMLLAWLAVLIPSGPLPVWYLATWMCVLALGAPASMVAFDYSRLFNTPGRLGRANGFINTGGFTATILGIVAIAVVLDRVAPEGMGTYTIADFRIAFSTLLIPWVMGVIGVLTMRPRTRSVMLDHGVAVSSAREQIRLRRRAFLNSGRRYRGRAQTVDGSVAVDSGLEAPRLGGTSRVETDPEPPESPESSESPAHQGNEPPADDLDTDSPHLNGPHVSDSHPSRFGTDHLQTSQDEAGPGGAALQERSEHSLAGATPAVGDIPVDLELIGEAAIKAAKQAEVVDIDSTFTHEPPQDR